MAFAQEERAALFFEKHACALLCRGECTARAERTRLGFDWARARLQWKWEMELT